MTIHKWIEVEKKLETKEMKTKLTFLLSLSFLFSIFILTSCASRPNTRTANFKNGSQDNKENLYELICSKFKDISFNIDTKKIISNDEIFRILYNRESGELSWSSYNENKKLKSYQFEEYSKNGSRYNFQRTIRFKRRDSSSAMNETLYLTSVRRLDWREGSLFSEMITVNNDFSGGYPKPRQIPWSISDAQYRCMSPWNIEHLKRMEERMKGYK